MFLLVWSVDGLGGPCEGERNFSFTANDLLIATLRLMPSDSPGPTPPGVVAHSESNGKIMAMLALAAANIGLEWTPPSCPEHSWLDDWFLGSEHGTQQRSIPVPCFTSSMTTRAYSAAGQATSTVHAMAILQSIRPRHLKTCTRVVQELCSATDFVL